jgi:hypothetical protein
MTDCAPSDASSPSNFYREIACGLRTLVPTVKFPRARDTLLMLADDYEKLAAFVETRPRRISHPLLGTAVRFQPSSTAR